MLSILILIVSFSIYNLENKLSKQRGFNSDVIFPDDDRLRTLINDGKNYAEIRVSETMLRCGKDQLFCENVQNYPKEFVNRMLKENFDLHVYAFEDAVSKLIIVMTNKKNKVFLSFFF